MGSVRFLTGVSLLGVLFFMAGDRVYEFLLSLALFIFCLFLLNVKPDRLKEPVNVGIEDKPEITSLSVVQRGDWVRHFGLGADGRVYEWDGHRWSDLKS